MFEKLLLSLDYSFLRANSFYVHSHARLLYLQCWLLSLSVPLFLAFLSPSLKVELFKWLPSVLEEIFLDFCSEAYCFHFDLLSHAGVIIDAQSLAETRP